MFSTLTHDLAVLQRRVLLPLKRAEQSIPPNSSMYTKQIGMKKMKWVGEDIKLKKSQPKEHRLTLKTEVSRRTWNHSLLSLRGLHSFS